jgi:hypothetical protein
MIADFWDVTPCTLVDRYQSCRRKLRPSPLKIQKYRSFTLKVEATGSSETSIKLHGVTAQKTVILILIALGTSKLSRYQCFPLLLPVDLLPLKRVYHTVA